MPSRSPVGLRGVCQRARTLAKQADPLLAFLVKIATLAYYLVSIRLHL